MLGYGLADPSTDLGSRPAASSSGTRTAARAFGIEVTTTDALRSLGTGSSRRTTPFPLHPAEQAVCLSLAASAWRDGDPPATARRNPDQAEIDRKQLRRPAGPHCDLSGEEIPDITVVDERRLSVTFDYVPPASAAPGPALSSRSPASGRGRLVPDAVEPAGAHRPDASSNRRKRKEPLSGCDLPAGSASPVQSPSMGALELFTRLPLLGAQPPACTARRSAGRALGLRSGRAHLDPASPAGRTACSARAPGRP